MSGAPETTPEEPSAPQVKKSVFKRLLPLLILGAGLAAFFGLGLNDYVSLDTLRDNREALGAWVAANLALAVGIYVLTYALSTAFSLPTGALLTLTGGFLFGTWLGGFLTVIGATIGASVVFLAAKTALGDVLRAKAGGAIRKMEEGFRENAFNYLLVLRLVPLFPFFVVNLAPAFLGVPLRTYVAATFIGIIPGTFVYASVGNGLGAIFAAGQEPDLGIIFKPEVLGPIVALAALSLVPVFYKKIKARSAGKAGA